MLTHSCYIYSYLITHFISGTKILIAGGLLIPTKPTNTSYILEVFFNDTAITKIMYKDLPNVPNSVQEATFGSYRGRSLVMGGYKSKGQCLEFDQEEYQVIPSLNVNRFVAASTLIQNKVVVVGGWDDDLGHHLGHQSLNTIEILDWDESNHGSQWIKSPSKMPMKVNGHTLVTFNDKLYLIGGNGNLDTIWEGSFDKLSNTVTWVKLGLRLQKKRERHFSFVISNQIISFGGRYYGEDYGEDFIEILEEKELKQGPKLPCRLDNYYDQAVLDRKNRIIITSEKHGLIIYDHEVGKFQSFPNFKLREVRTRYAAILQ